MTKKEFFEGVPFQIGPTGSVFQYKMVGGTDPLEDGIVSERTGLRHIERRHCGNIEQIHPRGVRVYSFWLGKRVSRFLFFKDLHPLEAKGLAGS